MKRFLFLFLALIPLFAYSQVEFDKAEKLYFSKNYEQSKVLFENYLKENPNHLKTLEYLGDIEGQNKSWDNAIYYYKKLKLLKPFEANYQYKYGGVLGMKAKDSNKFKALGMISEIKASFEKAISLNPRHIEARVALVELYLQLPGIVGGSEKKALHYANEIAQISPVDGYLSKGHIAEYFERFKEAELQYKKAVEISKSKNSYRILANLYKNKMGQPEKAKSVLEEIKN
jgi:tetratricopeptide (TPR) repeat protein